MPIRRDEDEHNSANATACDTEPVKTEWTKEELEQQGGAFAELLDHPPLMPHQPFEGPAVWVGNVCARTVSADVLAILEEYYQGTRTGQSGVSKIVDGIDKVIRDAADKFRRYAETLGEKMFSRFQQEPEYGNPFPIDVLPPVLRDLTLSIAKTYQSESKIGVIALTQMGVVSACLGQGIRVQGRRFVSLPNLFVYLSVGSGGVKSVAINEAMAPVEKFQEKAMEHFNEEELPQTLADLREIERKIENYDEEEPPTDDDGRETNLKWLLHEKSELEKKKTFCPVNFGDDLTIEGMIKHGIMFSRVFICSDEAASVESLISGRYSNGYTNESPICRIWSSGTLSRGRAGDNFSYNKQVTGAMTLAGQEHITRKLFEDEDLIQSGLIPRYLFHSTDTPMLPRNRSELTVSKEARANYATVINFALQNYWSITHESENKITTIGMTKEAMDALDDYHDSYCMLGNTTLVDARRSLHRIAEQATRIALLFHFTKAAGTFAGLESDVEDIADPISLETVQEAIKVVDWSLKNYLEYSRSKREDDLDELELELMDKAQTLKEPFTVRDMQRKARSGKLNGSDHVASILDGLVKKGKLEKTGGKTYRIPSEKAKNG